MSESVTVVIPAYNAAAYLPDAVASVLAQARPGLDLVIVDDGSTDDTPAVLARLEGPITRLRQTNQGVAAARNAGLAAATGALIAFVDADDVWPAGSLAALEQALAGPPAAAYAQGLTQLVRRNGAGEGWTPHGAPWLAPQLGAGLYRRALIERVGTFDAGLRTGEDVDWFLRVREDGAARAAVASVTLTYRWHGGNLTRGLDALGRNLPLLLARSIRRRAGSGGAP